MLTAILDTGSPICLADFENNQLLVQMRAERKFFCPTCQEKMILKIGTKKIPHFAHSRNHTCQGHFENETEYHLEGKRKLYNWLKQQGLNPELEVYDPEIKQRPDILLVHQGKRFALEFQCSSISENQFLKRTSTYQQAGYTPVWILAGNHFLRKNANIIKLSDFQYLAVEAVNPGNLLRFYCPVANQFLLLHNILPLTTRNSIANIIIRSPNELLLSHLLNVTIEHTPALSSALWQRQIKTFKLFYTQNPKSYRDPFLKALYFNHLHLVYLPPEIGLPSPGSIYIRNSPVIWQGYLYLDIFKNRFAGDFVSTDTIFQAVQKRIFKKQIIPRTLPLGTGNPFTAVKEYLDILEAIHYLRKVNNQIYQINYSLIPSKNMAEQEDRERIFYQNLKDNRLFKV